MSILKYVRVMGCIILPITAIGLFGQAPDTLWTKAYGEGIWNYGNSIKQLSSGGYIVVGYQCISDDEVYLIKTNSGGDTVWTKTYGYSDEDKGRSVQETADGGYVIVGWTYSLATDYDVYLIKTESNGDTSWTRKIGESGSEYGNSIQEVSDSFIVVGYSNSFGSGNDVYLIKTDANGDTVWTKTHGGSGNDFGNSVRQTSEGGYIIAGFTDSYGAGGYDVYLIKTDASGDTSWTKTYGGLGDDKGESVKQTSDGGYIIAGQTNSYGAGNLDVYLIKTDASGDTSWTRTFGGSNIDQGFSVVQTLGGSYVVCGRTWSSGTNSYDVWLLKVDTDGGLVWGQTYGLSSREYGYSAVQTSDGGYVITGMTEASGTEQVYIVKTEPDEIRVDEENLSDFSAAYLQVSPNPFRHKIKINLNTTQRLKHCKLKIFDVSGRAVKSFSALNGGRLNQISWDGRNDAGRYVSSGVYFLKLEAGDVKATKKILLTR